MKVEVKEEDRPSYPYLGKHGATARIVLFTSKNCGVDVVGKGEYSDEWTESSFTSFTGSVTLSN